MGLEKEKRYLLVGRQGVPMEGENCLTQIPQVGDPEKAHLKPLNVEHMICTLQHGQVFLDFSILDVFPSSRCTAS